MVNGDRHAAVLATILSIVVLTSAGGAQGQTNDHRDLKIGGIIGNPLGLALRCPIGASKSLDIGFGPDYFGSPRLQMDWVWKFHMFDSAVIGEYAGPGLAIAFAKGINAFYTHEPHKEVFASKEDDSFGFGGRAIFGISITPRNSPLQFFIESGPLIAARRIFDMDVDGAVGFLFRL